MESAYLNTTNQDRTVSAAPQVDISEFAGETVRVSLEADGRWTYPYQNTTSWVRVDYITISQPGADTGFGTDSDGDGLPDSLEERGVPLANGQRVELSPTDSDTDGDGLSDGEEIHLDKPVYTTATHGQRTFVGYEWSSDPSEGVSDTDGDGLTDSEETDGVNISVVTTSDDEPLHWAADSTAADRNMTVTSDPTNQHSDGDGITDGVEVNELRTDPDEDVTYHVTQRRSGMLTNFFIDDQQITEEEWNLGVALGIFSKNTAPNEVMASTNLDDGTDDFDFVSEAGTPFSIATDEFQSGYIEAAQYEDLGVFRGSKSHELAL